MNSFTPRAPFLSTTSRAEPLSKRSRELGNRLRLPRACRAIAEIFPISGVSRCAMRSLSLKGITLRTIADTVASSPLFSGSGDFEGAFLGAGIENSLVSVYSTSCPNWLDCMTLRSRFRWVTGEGSFKRLLRDDEQASR